MKNYTKKGEWCKIVLFNKLELCLKYNFCTRELGTFIIAFKISSGIAIGVLGLLIEFNYNKNTIL
jgi:hypothetical protein|tara:strand:+ start:830 stop:1024 length:195 start_codon:yes stop_codon:yes gene_type:complete